MFDRYIKKFTRPKHVQMRHTFAFIISVKASAHQHGVIHDWGELFIFYGNNQHQHSSNRRGKLHHSSVSSHNKLEKRRWCQGY